MNGVAVEADRLTKRFGSVSAVEGISLTVTHGRVTGLLGPNGAGKSTTFRMLLGLVRPDEGAAVFGRTRYVDLPDPTARVGAVIDGGGLQPSLTARQHLRVHAALGGHDDERVETVSALLGTDAFARRRVRTFSLGMRQRLSVATALLGDPSILILDEPANGLDPAGIAWLRGFLRDLADRGGAVLLASHVLSEVEQIVDDIILVDRGRTIRRGSLGDLTDGGQRFSRRRLPDADIDREPNRRRRRGAPMKRVITGELRRLFGTRIPAWAAVTALAAGAFFPAVISIVGPEKATPPMPGLDTPEGVQIVLGIAGLTLFLPALLGVFAVAGEYQHRTIVTTFITVPRRGTVLVAKLLVYAFAGLGYGILLSASTGAVLLLHAGISGTPLGLAPADLARDLVGVALAAVAYTAIGVAVGAITRNLLLAAGIVLGWFSLVEPLIMLIPGINTAYPLLPGGATASLVGFTFLTDAMSAQLHLSGPSILSPWVGALVLFVYAAVAAAIAFVLPLRRDIA